MQRHKNGEEKKTYIFKNIIRNFEDSKQALELQHNNSFDFAGTISSLFKGL